MVEQSAHLMFTSKRINTEYTIYNTVFGSGFPPVLMTF